MKSLVIAGRLTKDAEQRQAGGNTVTAFSVAVDHGFGQNKTAMFFECSFWGKRGESIRHLLTKGKQVTASGDFSTREYNGKTYLELNVENITLQGGGNSGGTGQQGGQQQQRAPGHVDVDDGEIPF